MIQFGHKRYRICRLSSEAQAKFESMCETMTRESIAKALHIGHTTIDRLIINGTATKPTIEKVQAKLMEMR